MLTKYVIMSTVTTASIQKSCGTAFCSSSSLSLMMRKTDDNSRKKNQATPLTCECSLWCQTLNTNWCRECSRSPTYLLVSCYTGQGRSIRGKVLQHLQEVSLSQIYLKSVNCQDKSYSSACTCNPWSPLKCRRKREVVAKLSRPSSPSTQVI